MNILPAYVNEDLWTGECGIIKAGLDGVDELQLEVFELESCVWKKERKQELLEVPSSAR